MPNVIDLFSGAGGLSLGAARAGFNVVASVENDKFAVDTHMKNFPQTTHFCKDITTLDVDELRNIVAIDGDVFGVIGGPPCQGFSSIGNQNVDDQRNTLFHKFFEIVADLQPDFYIAENVPGIMNEKYDNLRSMALELVDGYVQLPALTIRAYDYGAPTLRTRIFFIGYRNNLAQEWTQQDFMDAKVPLGTTPTVENALKGLPKRIRFSKKHSGQRFMEDFDDINDEVLHEHFFYSRAIGHIPDNVGHRQTIEDYLDRGVISGCFPTNHTPNVRNRYKKVKCGKADKISKSIKLDPEGFCPTLRAGTGPERGSYQAVRPLHYKSPRVITPREAARLQGFPDWFVFQPTIWHSFRQIGNSVSPLVAERILSVIYQKFML